MLVAVKEELESPCTEEMAVFEEFSKMVEQDDFEYVVFDTAPTGHTLRLLELPYDYARQVEMMVSIRKDDPTAGDAKKKLDALVGHLKDRDRCTFLLVLYPESTPIFEAKRASEDLRDAGIDVQGVIANLVLDEKDCTTPFVTSRFRMQRHYLGVAGEQFRLPMFKVPMLDGDLAGKDALDRVGRKLFGDFRVKNVRMVSNQPQETGNESGRFREGIQVDARGRPAESDEEHHALVLREHDAGSQGSPGHVLPAHAGVRRSDGEHGLHYGDDDGP
jgi:anion-transporting  ArsA/GET3 family ATPase